MTKLHDRTLLGRRTLLGAAGAATFAAPAIAQAPVSFAGRTIEFVIPFAEAGGSDVWARFLAPFLARHLPGQPNVIVRNVPGGGSITGSNDWAQRARPDGSSLFGPSASTHLPFLLGDRRVRYDYANWTPVIVSPTGGVVWVSTRTGITDGADIARLRGQELVFPSQGATGFDLVPILALHLLGLNVRYVFGMRGRGEARIAVERGDASIDHQTTPAYLSQVVPLVQAGQGVPLFSYGLPDAQGVVQRDPSFPDIPTFEEVYQRMHGRAPSGQAYEAYRAASTAAFAGQKPAVLLKSTPAPIIAAYRRAFEAIVADPELKARGEAVLGVYPQAVGDAADSLYRHATTISPEAREWARNFLTTTHNVRF
ncbi:Bug family tripartite tricarboxylate transporter substrate binding protein [Roseococcus suduntuyensis]|uniref:Tripartite-type tricarboxylate transporter receptor subunit TctC n=1 Tax=Roseococcus suduntuyensis TaxID=455361 RepID=A0A840ADA2_9PROT|nr:tricarboxylate transporter [Roseococcus suduntuyensis]MBB3898516.1 tripartite-type tricarboxylate transporter receptor subunit TctC [Roseococcus suduntuyensis]